MSNCAECASLCCIAPEIRSPDLYQGRAPWKVIKILGAPCENLCWSQCSIYDSRWTNRTACIGYDCKDFGPVLTGYLKREWLFEQNGTLKPYWMKLFILLNWMLRLSSPLNKDLEDALSFFNTEHKWPQWMLTQDYYDYLFTPWILRKNPRKTLPIRTEASEVISKIDPLRVVKSLYERFMLAFPHFSL